MLRLAPALILIACQQEPVAPTTSAPALTELPQKGAGLGHSDWLDQHFVFPIPEQGPAPDAWTELEASLDPDSCGTCHPAQLADWKESWHHLGMGPGVMGQLVDWDGSDDRTVAQCQTCHAPMTEQHLNLYDEEADLYLLNTRADPDMRSQGLTCAGCHVRQHQRLGPPRDGRPADDSGRALAGGAHDGFLPREEFQSAAFCSTCHDFKEGQLSHGGKLVQETGPEWLATDFSADGVTCQGCHMPEGRHLWKGIHDPEMVRKAVAISGSLDDSGSFFSPVRANLSLENVAVGHRLPTYTTPDIKLILVQRDRDGNELVSTRREGSIARRLTPNLRKELYDTRLLPGESLTLPYASRRHPDAHSLGARVEVWPDEAYRRFYEIKLRHPENHPLGKQMLEEALQASTDSRFTIWEEHWTL